MFSDVRFFSFGTGHFILFRMHLLHCNLPQTKGGEVIHPSAVLNTQQFENMYMPQVESLSGTLYNIYIHFIISSGYEKKLHTSVDGILCEEGYLAKNSLLFSSMNVFLLRF